MRKCEEESSDGELSLFRSVHFFLVVAMFGKVRCKVQKIEGPTRKIAGEPVQGYVRDCELLIGFFVDRFEGFYPYLFLQAKFSR